MTDQRAGPWPDELSEDAPGIPANAETAGRGPGLDALGRLMDNNFVQYASYVIRDRAIPDLADGLKPVQRRILHALRENDDGKFIKVANIVGHTMQYHPHGDASIGDALVNLANKRYLIEGQGNFGNIFTGDPAAASRYIECRLTDLAREELFHPDLTTFIPSYDGRRQEPVQLPARIPLLLMLGAEGIAVGLSTRILPHNFRELVEAQIAILRKHPFTLYPDFPQGGLMDASEYDAGNGKVRLRAAIETAAPDRLVIREIPYGTTTDSVMASIEDAARKKKLSILSLDDFTAERVEIQVTLPPEQHVQRTIQRLYAFTQCEVSLSVRLMVIRDNQPAQMDVHEVLRETTRRLVSLLKRALRHDERRLQEALHRKTLVQLFVEHRLYKAIEECKSYDNVQAAVQQGLAPFRKQLQRDITGKDVEMLLAIPIRRISRFDIAKSRDERDAIVTELEKITKQLADLKNYAIRYLRGLLRRHGDAYPRCTRIETFQDVAVRTLTARELAMVYDAKKGYFGHALQGEPLFECSSHDRLLLVWNDGRYKVVQPPDKLFVDQDLVHAAVADRKRTYTMVYVEEGITYLKRFTFGGTILNKDYRCAPRGAEVLLFADDDPPEIYVKYKKEKRQRIHQQVFPTAKIGVKNVKARGGQMTVKAVRWVGTKKPRNWARGGTTPSGSVMDFV